MKRLFMLCFWLVAAEACTQGLPKKISLYEKSVFVSGMSGKLNEQELLNGVGLGGEFFFMIRHLVYVERKDQRSGFVDKTIFLLYQPSMRFGKDYHFSFQNTFLYSLKNKLWRTGPFSFYQLDYIDLGISIQNELEPGGVQLIGPQLNFKFYLPRQGYFFKRLNFQIGLNYYFGLNQISKNNSGLYGDFALRMRLNKFKGGGF